MNKLTFDSHFHEVEINGITFLFEPGRQSITKAMQVCGEESVRLSESGLDSKHIIEKGIKIITTFIDEVLGEGATDQIMYNQRKDNLYLYMDVGGFLRDEINKFRTKKNKKYLADTVTSHIN